MFHLFLAATIAALPHVRVDLARDAGMPCAVHAALAEQLRALSSEQSAPAARGELLAALSFRDEAWRLELRDPQEQLVLSRELRLAPDQCALVAESAALVIDRYLAALRLPPGPRRAAASSEVASPEAHAQRAPERSPAGASTDRATRSRRDRAASSADASRATMQASPGANAKPRAPLEALKAAAPGPDAAALPSPPARQPEPPAELPPPLVAATATVVAPPALHAAPPESDAGAEPRRVATPAAPGSERAPPEELAVPPARQGLTLSLGPAALVGVPSDARFAGWLELEHPFGWLSTRVLVVASASSNDAQRLGGSRASLNAQTDLIAISGGPCLTLWVRACASAVVGGRGTIASARGDAIFQRSLALLVQPELGGELSFDRQLPRQLELRLTLLAGAALGSATFGVAGGPQRSLDTVDLGAALLLGYHLF